MSLPSYRDCEYSLFVSYAHADDSGHNAWVTALKDAFWERLSLLDRHIPRLNLHLSGVNGPAVGRLGDELQERVRKSFGMLIVVGPQYVSSGWCERELELFQSAFRVQNGFGKRLLIAAMGKGAYENAREKPVWKKLIPKDQLWRPFYHDDSSDVPIDPKRDDGTFTTAFWREASTLADALIKEIQDGWARTEGDGAQSISIPPRQAIGQPHLETPQENQAQGKTRVLIGSATADLEPAVRELREQLTDAGLFEVRTLSPERVSQWEKDGQLADELSSADALVAPFSEAPPLNPHAMDGGHLAIQQREWGRLAKSRPILWYRPTLVGGEAPAKPSLKASESHLAYVGSLSPVYASCEAIQAALLANTPGTPRITIYIEKNPKEKKLWKGLGQRLGEIWEELNRADHGPAFGLDIRTRPLDIDKLNRSQPVEDADGVVLLYGYKHPTSLLAQINRVEDVIPIRRSVFPGFVALLIPPHGPDDSDVAEHGWDFFRFSTEQPPGIRELRDEDTEDVKAFLRDIRAQCKQRFAVPT